VDNDSADVTSEDRPFHVRVATTGKARLVTVDSLTGGTTRWLVPAERRDCQPGWSAIRLSEQAMAKQIDNTEHTRVTV